MKQVILFIVSVDKPQVTLKVTNKLPSWWIQGHLLCLAPTLLTDLLAAVLLTGIDGHLNSAVGLLNTRPHVYSSILSLAFLYHSSVKTGHHDQTLSQSPISSLLSH